MKNKVFQFRATADDIQLIKDTAEAGTWHSVSDMVRELVKEAAAKQSQRLPQASEQSQPAPLGDEPQL